MIILDTNVLSELMQRRPEPPLSSWLNSQSDVEVLHHHITLFEARYGLDVLADGAQVAVAGASLMRCT